MWFCCQIGAREHYAVSRALHQVGKLRALYTDYWAGNVTRGISAWQSGKQKAENRNRLGFGKLHSLAARFHPELGKTESGKQRAEIVSWNFRGLYWEAILRKQKAESKEQKLNPYTGFIEVGRRFAVCVREELKRKQKAESRKQSGGDWGITGRLAHRPSNDWIVFAYDTGALEVLEWCNDQGLKTVLGQMDPNRVEVELVQAEENLWPGWALNALQVPEEYFARREQEWALADRIVVNSEFCRQALLQQGVPAEKLVVIPLCYEAKAESRKQKTETGGLQSDDRNKFQLSAFPISSLSPLRVLFLGQVILRKGIQYLMAAARQLETENIHFDIVGPIGISASAVSSAPKNVTFHGRTGRDQASKWYQQSHLFVLPTLSDGFAITQLEAMAHGLPVVTTPCCGDVVTDGVDGFIVPPRAVEELVRTFQRYLTEPELLRSHSTGAMAKAQQFTLKRLAENLQRLEANLA